MQHVTLQPTAGSGSLPCTPVLQVSSFRCQRNQVLIKQWLGSLPAGSDNILTRPKHLFWKEPPVETAPPPSHSALKSAVTLKYINGVYILLIHQLYAGEQIATAPTQLPPKPCSSEPLRLLTVWIHTSRSTCCLCNLPSSVLALPRCWEHPLMCRLRGPSSAWHWPGCFTCST